jgi:hypothetical protein
MRNVCWRLKCDDEPTHKVIASGGRPVETCKSCAESLVDDGKWDQHKPLTGTNQGPEP